MKNALFWLFVACTPIAADQHDFRELFADSATRKHALAQLIPGSRQAYFFTALDHQLSGRDKEFQRVMGEWKAAADRSKGGVSLHHYDKLENRQLLLAYEKQPDKVLAELIDRLNLYLDHSRPDAEAAAESLPTRVSDEMLSEERFNKLVADKSQDRGFALYLGERRYRELAELENFNPAKVQWFVERLDRADLPQVVDLVSRAMDNKDWAFSFRNHSLLKQMTAGQLEELAAKRPEVKQNLSFNISYLSKIRPGPHVDLDRDLEAHAQHLQKCRDYVLGLDGSANGLKAHVLYHHLRLQSELDRFPKEDFLRYLALPRRGHGLIANSEDYKRLPSLSVDDCQDSTACWQAPDDTELIMAYLNHFLGQTDSAKDFLPYIDKERLTPIHAKARLLAGADPERWGKLISGKAFRDLQEEVRIRFAPGTPQEFASDAKVSLELELKNTPQLLVRIYELDLPAYLKQHNSWPDAKIDLDGLVPHHERFIDYDQPALLQHREVVALPELEGPGTWLIDFVSGQASVRALIRKGHLSHYIERTADSQKIRVFNEAGELVKGARFELGREVIEADQSGVIVVPNRASQAVTRGIVQAGKLANQITVGNRLDELEMDVRFLLAREQLLADQDTRLRLRLRLTNHGHEIPLERIMEPTITLRAELMGGVTTERVIADKLELKEVMELPFQVPADLLQLTLTVRGSVEPKTGGKPVRLEGEANYALNSDLKTAHIGAAFFSPTTAGHRLELRGRNGEPLPNRAVTLDFEHHHYAPSARIRMRTDEQGRIDLGPLNHIKTVSLSSSGIGRAFYKVPQRLLFTADEIRTLPVAKIVVPLEKPDAGLNRIHLSLLETHYGKPVRDHFDKLAIEDGQLFLRKLPPGTYRLQQSGCFTDIHVVEGIESGELLISKSEILPKHNPVQPFIESTKVEKGQFIIALGDFGPKTRVTAVGKRYLHEGWSDGGAAHPFALPTPPEVRRGYVTCDYLTGRRLSDEMRYILDRRNTKTYPGAMLPRPGLLLNRWTERDSLGIDMGGRGEGRGGSGYDAVPGSAKKKGESGRHDKQGKVTLASSCDFLERPAAVLFNLVPDADGRVSIPTDAFTGCQFLEITAADQHADDKIIVPLAPNDTPVRERRIARPMNPEHHHIATRRAAVLKKGATASIENLLDADWRAFTTLAEAHQLLYGMQPEAAVRDFIFLTEWPDFDEKQKLHLLATHPCHELHLFIARKDKAFFDKHIKPMLEQKPEPQFIDDLLLGRDLSGYLRPFAWSRLNAAEKALLAQAMPDARERIEKELRLRWEKEAPTPGVESMLFTQTLRGSDLDQLDSLGLASNQVWTDNQFGTAYITEKMRNIVIPSINFEDTTLEDAIEFLRMRATELDTLELDPAKKGMSFVVRAPQSGGYGADAGLEEALGGGASLGGSDPGEIRIAELKAKNVPLEVALKYICDATKMRYKIDNHAITIVPQTETGEDIFTRTFTVPPDFSASLSDGDTSGEIDPFAPVPAGGGSAIQSLPPVEELLKKSGISFPEGASVTLTGNKLLVSNTPTELDKIESLTQSLACMEPDPARLRQARGFAGLNSGGYVEADPFAALPSGGGSAIEALPPSYLHMGSPFPESTKVWREANYYENSEIIPANESLIQLNAFWLDLAGWDGKGPFLSPHFNSCTKTLNEVLMCLAVLDLPFKAGRPEVEVEGSTLTVKALEPMILFYKDTRRTEQVAENSPLLLRQSFSPLHEKFRMVDGQQVENPVTGKFRPGVPYSATLVVTNPTGIGRRIDLLAQIPAGAIPLEGHPSTLSTTVDIQPHGVVQEYLSFYFPAPGEFPVYPLHVCEEGQVMAHADKQTLVVSSDPGEPDASSWLSVARDGSDEEVLKRLEEENLHFIELDAICWRLKDKDFYLKATAVLDKRLHFNPEVMAYAFMHNDKQGLQTYLENSEAVEQLGAWLDSPLLEIRPRIHQDWETLEFEPLINPRAHRFGEHPRLSNRAALERYQEMLEQWGWKPALDSSDQLNWTTFLLLQDRIEEALERFEKIVPAELETRLVYDYLHAVVLFYQEKPEQAKQLAAGRLPKLPPGIWRERFEAVILQADEIAALKQSGMGEEPLLEDTTPKLEVLLAEEGKLLLKHHALEKAELRLFSVDLEMLFSKDPFLKGDGGNAYLSIRPNHRMEVELRAKDGRTLVELPKPLDQGNLLVTAESGSTQQLKVLDSRAIDLRHQPLERTVQVLDQANGKPLVKTYVKVYAEHQDGSIQYHKDGYTDLRGKFDYLSHTGMSLKEVKRVALLVSHPKKGARTIIYDR